MTLYCKTYQGDEVDLPILYERLLEKANEKFTKVIEKADYDPSYNIVLPVIEAISKRTLFTGKRHFEKSETREECQFGVRLGLSTETFYYKINTRKHSTGL